MRDNLKKLYLIGLCLFLILLAMPNNNMINPIKIAYGSTVKLTKKEITINIGEKYQLKITGTKSKVKWSSPKKSIATVSSTGLVTGKKAGSIYVIAEVGDKELSCRVNVVVPTIQVSSMEKGIGVKTQYKVGNLPKKYSNDDILWSSSNEDILTIDNTGLSTTVGIGEVKITATFGEYKISSKVFVTATKKNFTDAVNNLKIEYAEYGSYIDCVIKNDSIINLSAICQMEFYDKSDNLVSISQKDSIQLLKGEETVIFVEKPNKEYSYYIIKFDNESNGNGTNLNDTVSVEVSLEYDYTHDYYNIIENKSVSETAKLFDLIVNNKSKKRIIFTAYVLYYKEEKLVRAVYFTSFENLDVGVTT
ncbi:MAG: Ig-like domain-containing protein, partial [Mobilitalea sp.]